METAKRGWTCKIGCSFFLQQVTYDLSKQTILANFLKILFHKFCLVHSWILCLVSTEEKASTNITSFFISTRLLQYFLRHYKASWRKLSPQVCVVIGTKGLNVNFREQGFFAFLLNALVENNSGNFIILSLFVLSCFAVKINILFAFLY